MMDVTLDWKKKMAFQGVAGSGFSQNLDADESVGGENSAARPMEFIAIGLAGCTAMDVISILRKKKQEVSDFQVKLHTENAAEHPKVFTSAVIEYIVTGREISEAAVLRSIELSAEKYCPAQAMLSLAFPMRLIYKIFNDNGLLVREGEYGKSDPL
jgi:putative redox protein